VRVSSSSSPTRWPAPTKARSFMSRFAEADEMGGSSMEM
jgi:hypothetical protein